MLRSVLILAVTLSAAPALAAASGWQDLAPGVRARLISSGEVTGGKTLAGLEIDMPQTTNTYWRIPGETGIPTVFDFSASSGIADATPHWPFPLIEDSSGYRDFVYRGPTVLPVEITVGGGAAILEASVTLGICEDMCVPARAHFILPLDPSPDAGQSLRLKQALALTPILWEGAAFGSVRAVPEGVELTDPAPGLDPAQLIADPGDAMLLFGAPQKSPQAAIWTLPLLGGADGSALAGRTVQFTFLTAEGAFSASAVVAN